ncbi:hypothetical protein HZC21_02435 [Candidatus Peregrinibacteria bacterium]|nr:hypothetical protein [Candidatus Peregrinibacteria bacterium]
MQHPKKLVVSISIGVLILIGVFAVISLTPSGIFTGAMRSFKKSAEKSKIRWWCITEEEADKKYKDYWCNQNPIPEWAKEICKDYNKGTSSPGGQTLAPGVVEIFKSGKFPIDPDFIKWFKMYYPKDSGSGMIKGNVPQPEPPPDQNIPPEDKNEGTPESSKETTPPKTREIPQEFNEEQYCKDLAAGNVGLGCDCGQKTKVDTTCHVTVTCNYWPPDSVCDPQWQCKTGYVQDETGVDEKCINEILYVKKLQCAGKKATVNPDVEKVCKAFGNDYMFEWLDKPCVSKEQCKHLKKLIDEGLTTSEATAQLGMSAAEYDSCTALFNAEWNGKKPW